MFCVQESKPSSTLVLTEISLPLFQRKPGRSLGSGQVWAACRCCRLDGVYSLLRSRRTGHRTRAHPGPLAALLRASGYSHVGPWWSGNPRDESPPPATRRPLQCILGCTLWLQPPRPAFVGTAFGSPALEGVPARRGRPKRVAPTLPKGGPSAPQAHGGLEAALKALARRGRS